VALTISIAGGPFLGLLGTVVGVMITFAAIAAAGDVNVNAIAPGIAAALVATVAGLAVAIPALFGYNWLASQIKNASSDGAVFLDEFITKSAEMHSAWWGWTVQVQAENQPFDDINVTPMLDLAYVLLVIFIVMTTASVQGLKVDLPKPSNKPSLEKKETRIVQIQSDGSLLLNGAVISMTELESRLAAAMAKDPQTSIVIKGDPQAYYAMVVDIIDLAARLNITNVGDVSANIGTMYANAGAQGASINSINANIGAYYSFANANLATQTTNINTINANIGTLFLGNASTQANLGTATNNITTLFSNAATQQTQITSLYTNANANTAAYLSTNSLTIGVTGGNTTVGGNLVVAGNLFAQGTLT